MTIRRIWGAFVVALPVVLCLTRAPLLAQQAALDKALFDSSWQGNEEEVVRLLAAGANPNVTQQGSTPLHKAAMRDHRAVMTLLINGGANVNVKDNHGRTPLAEAAGSRTPDAVKLLLDSGAKADGFALGQAAGLGRLETVKLLLDARANPDDGLVRAAQGGHVEIVKLLLQKGADVKTRAQSDLGDTALHTAALQGGVETVELLLKHGADPNAVNNESQTPLHRAIAGDSDLRRVKLLVESGARLDIPDKNGMTPVRFAGPYAANDRSIYAWLLEAAGGREPPPARPAREKAADRRSTKELIAALSAKDYKHRQAAEQELVARGKEIVPDLVQALDAGQPVEQLSKLLVALGPEAEAAVPKVEALLNDKGQVFAAALTLDRMKPGALDALPQEQKERTATTLYESIVDPETHREMAGWHLSVLVRLGEVSVPHILKLLKSTDPEYRRMAVESLYGAPFASEKITDELIELSQDSSHTSARQAAAQALGRFGEATPEVRAALLAILKSPPQQRARKADGLPTKEWQEWLQAADSAARSLVRFGPDIIDDLQPLLSPLEAPSRKAAIAAMSSLGPDAIPRLTELSAHEDKAVAIAAQIALGSIKSKTPKKATSTETRP